MWSALLRSDRLVPNVIVFGLQWGDEGKGKIVDRLAERADIVVRYQGGHNAGHTLVVGTETFKLSLLPSGIIRDGTRCVIGNGVVVDPWALQTELRTLRQRGVNITSETLAIADSAALILPLHAELDGLREAAAAGQRIGTTGRGIGPAYEDKVGRRAVRLADLRDSASLDDALRRLLTHHDPLRMGLGASKIDRHQLTEQLETIAPTLLEFAHPTGWIARHWIRPARRALFEGAQGAMLDLDHGTYPFVTSSNTVPSGAGVGSGVDAEAIGFALAVCKAYATRVGSGPFPSELPTGPIHDHLSRMGKEMGTVTGRQRRCGWFDAVAARHACEISGARAIALTKIDVLDGLDTIQICVGYRIDGQTIDYLPTRSREQVQAEPVLETMPGWTTPTAGVRSMSELPSEAAAYIRRIEALLKRPISIISTSPRRDDTIIRNDPFEAA